MLLLRSLAMLIAKPAARPATPAGPAHLLPLASLLTALLLAPAIPAQAELAVTRGSALAVSSASQPVPDGRQDWTYTLKAGESFVEVARELLRSHISIPQLASYNGAASPDGLRSGDRIRIPVAWLRQQPEPAQVTGVVGHAQIQPAGGAPLRRLAADDLIRTGDTIITRDGVVNVSLADGSSLRIRPASTVVFSRLSRYGRTGMTDTRMRLERGGVSNRVQPLIEDGARFEIETPSAIAAVRGTAFALQTDSRGSHLQVTEGTVDFGRPGAMQDIPAGYAAILEHTRNGAVRVRPLPPAPQADAVPEPMNRLPGKVQWQPNGADRYQVDIIGQESGQWVRRDQTSVPELTISNLANGQYRLEIAALAADGIAGLPLSLPLEVDLAARAAELLEPAADAALDSNQPRFRWQFRGDSEKARVEVARDAEFHQVVASSEWSNAGYATPNRPLAAGRYYWRVVTEAGGTSSAVSEARALTINGSLAPVHVLSANYMNQQVRIFWETIDQATGYLLQLSEDPTFEEVLKEATVTDTTAALRLIPGRRYFVRLRAIPDGPLAAQWGPGRELYVE